jgi:preprotein translocase subunit SecD
MSTASKASMWWRRGLGIAGLAIAAVGAALVARGGRGFPGGIELEYSTDLDLAIDDRVGQLAAALNDAFAQAPWHDGDAAVWESARGDVLVRLVDPRRRDEALRTISARAGDALTAEPCPPDEPPGALCLGVPAAGRAALRRSLLDEAGEKVRARLRALDVEAIVSTRAEMLIVDVAGDADAIERAKTLLAHRGRLELARAIADERYADDLAAFVTTDPAAADERIRSDVDQWSAEAPATARRTHYLVASDRREEVEACEAREIGCGHRPAGDCIVTGRHVIERYLLGVPACHRPGLVDRDPRWRIPAGRRVVFEHVSSPRAPYWRSYYVERAPIVTGADVVDATPRRDRFTHQPIVEIDFDAAGRRRFADVTTAHVGDKLAFVIDGLVQQAPIINGPITGGSVVITLGGGDRAEAQAAVLAAVLRSGALPAPLVLERVAEAAAQPGPGPGPMPWILVGVGGVLVLAFAVWTMRVRARSLATRAGAPRAA